VPILSKYGSFALLLQQYIVRTETDVFKNNLSTRFTLKVTLQVFLVTLESSVFLNDINIDLVASKQNQDCSKKGYKLGYHY